MSQNDETLFQPFTQQSESTTAVSYSDASSQAFPLSQPKKRRGVSARISLESDLGRPITHLSFRDFLALIGRKFDLLDANVVSLLFLHLAPGSFPSFLSFLQTHLSALSCPAASPTARHSPSRPSAAASPLTRCSPTSSPPSRTSSGSTRAPFLSGRRPVTDPQQQGAPPPLPRPQAPPRHRRRRPARRADG